MQHISRLCTVLLSSWLLTGCITQSAALVSEPLQPQTGQPTAYLVGSIGPESISPSSALNQRLLFRKRGSEYGAAGIWLKGAKHTPEDIVERGGMASVFVLPLKPGDYELYDFQFFSSQYVYGLGSIFTSLRAREEFNLPLHLEGGKAYYLGEFRSFCAGGSQCAFLWRNQSARDQAIALQQVPDLPSLQPIPLDFKNAEPFIIKAPSGSSLPSTVEKHL